MKTKPLIPHPRAFTLRELVIVIAAMLLVAGVILPSLQSAARRAKRIRCVSYLKQIGTAHRLWAGGAGSTNDAYPALLSTNAGGALELAAQGKVWPVFQLLSNELNTPFVLICPADNRRVAANFSVLRNTNLSYFIGLDADETQPNQLLAGDRNLEVAGHPLAAGVANLTTNQPVGWTDSQHRRCGNVGLADGSVQQFSNERLREFLVEQGLATNRLVIP